MNPLNDCFLQNFHQNPPAFLPRRHFAWQRVLNDEVIGEKAFAVENPDLQAVAFISRDPQLAEAGQFFGSVSVYDFSTPKPVRVTCASFVVVLAFSSY